MSDPVILPIALSKARAGGGGFRPWFALAVPQAEAPVEDLYAKGLSDGQEMAAAAFAVERAQLQALLVSAQALQSEPSEELGALIAHSVSRLVQECVGAAPVDADHLNTQAAHAAALIGECDAARTMWVHPDDVALIDQGAVSLSVMADPAAQRGSIRIDCSAGWIEHGVPLYLEELNAVLGTNERSS